jgi:hypothetical protein
MPRYFFDTEIRGSVFPDPEGADFESDETAVRQAIEDAQAFGGDRLAHGGPLDGEIKIVRAETGDIIARFTIEEAVRRMRRN